MARCGSWRRSTTWTAARWGSWSERSRYGAASARRPSTDGSLASADLKGGAQTTVTVWLTLHLPAARPPPHAPPQALRLHRLGRRRRNGRARRARHPEVAGRRRAAPHALKQAVREVSFQPSLGANW